MKMKAPNKRSTRSNIDTSTSKSTRRGKTRTGRSTGRRESDDRRGRKPAKKQDNTKIFIGVGVGVFFLLIIIIAAANSGGGSAASSGGQTTSSKKKYQIPVAARKQIYSEYVKATLRFQDEADDEMSKLAADERRQKGPLVVRAQRTKEKNYRVKLSEKYRKKYPEASGAFVRDIVKEGDKKGW